MKKLLVGIINKLSFLPNSTLPVEEGAEYSIKKYGRTYKLLEEYDKQAIRDPEALADPGRVRPFIQNLQGKAGV